MKFHFPKITEAEIGVTTLDSPLPELPEGVALVMPRQTHTINVEEVFSPSDDFPDTDALITRVRGIAVGVRTADCVPVLLYAPDIKAVAAIHAGWRGTIGGICRKTVERLCELGADPAKIHAMIGAAVCGDCYEVSEELAGQFIDAGYETAVSGRNLDLKRVNSIILRAAGLQEGNIITLPYCTRHSTDSSSNYLFPSWRRESGTTVRLISTICLIPVTSPIKPKKSNL